MVLQARDALGQETSRMEAEGDWAAWVPGGCIGQPSHPQPQGGSAETQTVGAEPGSTAVVVKRPSVSERGALSRVKFTDL
jgi:hypothetical protein